MATEAQKKAVKKYKEKVKRITIDFHPAETDLWDQVSKQSNKQGYIKSLIRTDLEHKHCGFCEDFDRINEVVCYLPNDSGGSTNIPFNFCPSCGARLL